MDPGVRPSLLIATTVASMIQRFLLPYAGHFRGMGWRVEAMANGASDDPRIRAAFDDVHVHHLSRSVLDVPGIVRGIGRFREVLRGGYDIVHVHEPISALVTRVSARSLPAGQRPAVVYTAHGFHFHRQGRLMTNLLFLMAEKLAGRWTDRLIVINAEDEEAALRHRIVPREHLIRMPGIGIDTGAYSPDAVPDDKVDLARASLGIPPEVPLFVVVGELNRNKRPLDVVRALGRMGHTDGHLILLGDGSDRGRVEAEVRELDLVRRVRLPGVVDDVRPIVRAADAVILASTREGLPRSIMEALALGVPVIASAARGSGELVAPDAGIVVAIGDVPGLSAAMDWMVDHPAEARAMGERGRRKMVEGYDQHMLIRQHEILYAELLSERGSG